MSMITVQGLEEFLPYYHVKSQKSLNAKVMTNFIIAFSQCALKLEGIVTQVTTIPSGQLEPGEFIYTLLPSEHSLNLLYANLTIADLREFKIHMQKAITGCSIVNMTQIPTNSLKPLFSLMMKEIDRQQKTSTMSDADEGMKYDLDLYGLIKKMEKCPEKLKKWYTESIPSEGLPRKSFRTYWADDEFDQWKKIALAAKDEGFRTIEDYMITHTC